MAGIKKTILITGVSRGIGKATAELLIKEGYDVIGTSRNPDLINENDKIEKVKYIPLDLTCENSIENAVKGLKKVDILINNAGASQMGPVEEVDIDKIKKLYELNFFGHIFLMQKILHLMRKQKCGFVINITSLAGKTPVPYSSVYASCKGAMDILTKGLRNELRQFKIKVTAVAPSYTKTKIYQEKICEKNSAYYKNYCLVSSKRDSQIGKGTDPFVIAKKVLKIIKKKNPSPYYTAGRFAWIINALYKLMPEKLSEKILVRMFRE